MTAEWTDRQTDRRADRRLDQLKSGGGGNWNNVIVSTFVCIIVGIVCGLPGYCWQSKAHSQNSGGIFLNFCKHRDQL